MYITIVGPGPQVSKMGTFGLSCFYFSNCLRRENPSVEDVKKVIFHVKRK